MVTPKSVTPDELSHELQTLLSQYSFRVHCAARGDKFHVLLDYTSIEDWDPFTIKSQIEEVSQHTQLEGIDELHLYGRFSGQRSPEWHFVIPLTFPEPVESTDQVTDQVTDQIVETLTETTETIAPSVAQNGTHDQGVKVTAELEAVVSTSAEMSKLSGFDQAPSELSTNQTLLGNELIMMGPRSAQSGSPLNSSPQSSQPIPSPPKVTAVTTTEEHLARSGDIILGGRYQVLKVLGTGGFGRTFLAQDQQRPGHPTCVVKQFRPKFSDATLLDNARRQFNVEAETLEQLGRHDQIPRLLAYFEEGGDFFLVQEFIKGHSLSSEIQAGIFTEAQVITLLEDLLNVLAFVHDHQVIHRDIKPENVIRREDDHRLVLIDFGAGKQLQSEEEESVAIGTLGYNPPEQYSGSPQLNSDIYALGMVAIQGLTGLRPTQLSIDPKSGQILWRSQAKVTDKLADIIDRMVKVETVARYPSASAVLQDLERGFRPLFSPATLFKDRRVKYLQQQLQKPRILMSTGLGTLGVSALIFGISWFHYSNGLQTARESYYAGWLHAQTEDWPLAKQEYQAALNRNRLFPKARASLNHLMQRVEALEAEIPTKQSEYLDQPDSFEALLALTEAYIQTGDSANAIILLSRTNQQDNPQVFFLLGRAYAQQENWEQAVEHFEQAVSLNSLFVEARIQYGLALIQLGDYHRAVSTLRIATEISSNNQVAYYHLGRAHALLQEWDQAIQNYLIAISLNPDYLDMHHDLGYSLYASGQLDRAIQLYREAVETTPSPRDYYLLGNAYYANQDLDAAEAAYLQAIGENDLTADPLYYIRLGQVLAEQRDWEKAEDYLATSVTVAGDAQDEAIVASATSQYGFLLAEQAVAEGGNITQQIQQLEAAEQQLQAAIRQDSRDAVTHFRLGLVRVVKGDPQSAIDSLQASVQLNPLNTEARRVLADTLAQTGDRDEAVEQLTSVLDTSPPEPEVYLSLANVKAQEGDNQAALVDVKTAATLQAAENTLPTQPQTNVVTQQVVATANTTHINQVGRSLDPEQTSLTPEQLEQIAQSQNPAATLLAQAAADNLAAPNQIESIAGEPDPILGFDQRPRGLIFSVVMTSLILMGLMVVGSAGMGSMILLDASGLMSKRSDRPLSLRDQLANLYKTLTRRRTKEEKLRSQAQKFFKRGVSHFNTERWEEALAEFKEAIQTDRSYPEAYFYTGRTYDRLENPKDALVQYRIVDHLEPDYPDLVPAMTKATLKYGYQLFELDDYAGATEQFQTALVLCPEDAEPHYYMGFALSRLRDAEAWERAIAELSLAINLNVHMADAHEALGYVFSRQRKFKQAIESYQTALRINPNLAEAHHGLGRALYKHGDLHTAIQHFSNVLRLNSTIASVRTDLGFALLQAGDLDLARVEFNTVLMKESQSAEAHLGMGQFYFQRGKLTEADEKCKKALEIDPESSSAVAMLGLIHLEKQKQSVPGRNVVSHRTVEIAQARFETAIKTDLYVPEAHFGLGEISRMKREYAFALESYQNALRSNGSYTAAQFKLGVVYLALGNLFKAKEAFEKTVQLNPNYPEAKAYLERSKASGRDLPRNNTFIDLDPL